MLWIESEYIEHIIANRFEICSFVELIRQGFHLVIRLLKRKETTEHID